MCVCQRCVCRWANSSGAGKCLQGQQERKRRLGAEGGTKLVEVFFSFSVLMEMEIGHLLSELISALQTHKVPLMGGFPVFRSITKKENSNKTRLNFLWNREYESALLQQNQM